MYPVEIKKEFKHLVPPLSDAEYSQLEENIVLEGCREPLVCWRGIVVDGHNRLSICQEHGLPFEIVNKDFSDADGAEIWILTNQLGRRNLSDDQRAIIVDELIQKQAKISRETQLGDARKIKELGSVSNDVVQHSEKLDTRKEYSREAQISQRKIQKARKLRKEFPALADKVRLGEVTIHEAMKEVKKEEFKNKIEIIKQNIITKPDGLFDVIVIDPPWPYGSEYSPNDRRVASPYPEMSIEEIGNLSLPSSCDCSLWLWTTHRFIFEAKGIMDLWGFEYKGIVVWDKESLGIGSYLRMQCEFCLLGIKGKPVFLNNDSRDIVREKRREHSRKPDLFYSIIEKLCFGRKLEYFSREERPGYESYGNETSKF